VHWWPRGIQPDSLGPIGIKIGIGTLCRHNFEHNRYIWEFENIARIIGKNSGIIRRYMYMYTSKK